MPKGGPVSAPAHEPNASGDSGHEAVDAHGATHDSAHGHDDAHTQELGPIDWAAWAMAIAGGALAVLVAITLVFAVHP
jgi:hypothetical protein